MKRIVSFLMCLMLVLPMVGCAKAKEEIEEITHKHKWVEADCTSPKTCSKCGETKGEPLGHTWVEADCTTPKTCSVCGATEGEALGHTWVDADCTTAKTCSVCGATEGEPAGHAWVDADCTTPKTCSVCGATEGEAKGHQCDEWTVEKEPSCTETGSEKGICSVCGAEVTREIPMVEHEYGNFKTTLDPTCTKEGKETATCKVCGATIEQAIPATGHDPDEWEYNIPAESLGFQATRERKCKTCGQTIDSENCTMTSEERLKWLKKNCESGLYKKIARDPNEYKYQYVKFSGRVLQVCSEADSADGFSTYRLATNGWDDVVFIDIMNYGQSRILEDDRITIYGICLGVMSYTTVMGDTVTIPEVLVLEYET